MQEGRDAELDNKLDKFVLETVRNDIGEVTMVNDDVKTTIVQVKSQGQDKEKKGRSWL